VLETIIQFGTATSIAQIKHQKIYCKHENITFGANDGAGKDIEQSRAEARARRYESVQ
jgi:hypothetical protein